MENIRKAKWAYFLLAGLMILLGVYLVIRPGASVMAVCTLLGIGCLVFAAVKLVGYFAQRSGGFAFSLDFAQGVLVLVVGLLLLIRPGSVISLVQFVVGVFIVADSALKLQTAIEARRAGFPRWWSILLTALLSAAAGLLLIFNPFGTAAALMVLLGVTLIVEGVQNILVVLYAARRAKDDHWTA